MKEQGNEDRSRQRRRGRYPKEFLRDAGALVIVERRTIADVARQLGVVEQTHDNRVRQTRMNRARRPSSEVGRVPPSSKGR